VEKSSSSWLPLLFAKVEGVDTSARNFSSVRAWLDAVLVFGVLAWSSFWKQLDGKNALVEDGGVLARAFAGLAEMRAVPGVEIGQARITCKGRGEELPAATLRRCVRA